MTDNQENEDHDRELLEAFMADLGEYPESQIKLIIDLFLRKRYPAVL